MGTIATAFNTAFADGSPNARQPPKSEIRAIGPTIESEIATRDAAIAAVKSDVAGISSIISVVAAVIFLGAAAAPSVSAYMVDGDGRVMEAVNLAGESWYYAPIATDTARIVADAIAIGPRTAGQVGEFAADLDGRMTGVSTRAGASFDPVEASQAVRLPVFLGPIASGFDAIRYATDVEGRIQSLVDGAGISYALGRSGVFGPVGDAGAAASVPPGYVYNGAGAGFLSGPYVSLLSDPTILWCFPGIGQSLRAGHNDNATGDDAFSTTAPWPANAFMPSIGWRLELASNARFTSLVPIREIDSASSKHETQGTSFCNHLLTWLQDKVGFLPTLVTFSAAIGSKSWQQLMPGSQAWTNLTNAIADCAAIAAAQGKRLVVPAVLCNIGESNYDIAKTPAYLFARMLENCSRALNRDIRRITGQAEDVVMLCWGTIFAKGTQLADNPVFDAYARLDQRLIRVIGTHYSLPMSGPLHHDSAGYYRMGKLDAHAVLGEVFGPGFAAMRLIEAYRLTATKIRMRFSVPTAPVVIDTTGVEVSVPVSGSTNGWTGSLCGLELHDGAGNLIDISGATLAVVTAQASPVAQPNTELELTLGSAPSQPQLWLDYAWHTDGNDLDNGPVTGARGCIRDSSAIASLHDGFTDRLWCLPFRVRLGERLVP